MSSHSHSTDRHADLPQILEDAGNFERSFRDPADATRIQKGLTPTDILGKLGFSKVGFTEFDSGLQEALRKLRQDWYGKPFNRLTGELAADSVILKNQDESVIYFFRNGGGDCYAWSRVEKKGDGYYVDQYNHDSSIGEVIGGIAFYEIKHAKSPKAHPRYSGSDIKIPFVHAATAQETRDSVEGLVGLS